MPFKYMVDFLGGKKSRLDRIEERLCRIENSLHGQEARYTERSAVEMPRRRVSTGPRAKKARTINRSDGWSFKRRSERGLHTEDFGRDWVIEFDCPICGRTSTQGVKHKWTEHRLGHVVYHVEVSCNKCDWGPKEVDIRAFE